MKLFLDTASMEDIATRYETGLIAGITTNPTLVRRVVLIIMDSLPLVVKHFLNWKVFLLK